MSRYDTAHWPLEIRYRRAEKCLEVEFDDGKNFVLSAELLRVESPSAEVMGHGEGKTIVAGRRHVGIAEIEAVGNYAVRLVFDDTHSTGIYSWAYLRQLGENKDKLWADYLAALDTKGLRREA